MKLNLWVLGTLGVLSGIASTAIYFLFPTFDVINMFSPGSVGSTSLSTAQYDVGFLISLILPGLIYGVFTGIYFSSIIPLKSKKEALIEWVGASTASYAAAFMLAFFVGIGGLVGAFVLSNSFQKIFAKTISIPHGKMMLLGAGVHIVGFILTTPSTSLFAHFVVYISFQTISAILLGLAVNKSTSVGNLTKAV